MDFGTFKEDQSFPFRKFAPFMVKFEVYHKAFNGGSAESLNQAVMDYFVDHIREIQVKIENSAKQYIGDMKPWVTVLTPEIVAWIMDKDNPIRVWGNVMAHDQTVSTIAEAVETYVDTLPPLASNVKVLLYKLTAVHGSAVTMLEAGRRLGDRYTGFD